MIKKNFTINFCGRLYNIDEDAYELLSHYTETLRRYYSKTEGSEEIADDIESRIAELFDEEKVTTGNLITIELAERVIKQIGNIEQIVSDTDEAASSQQQAKTAGGEGAKSSATDKIKSGASSFAEGVADEVKSAWTTMKSDKRFYRDKQNALLAGVLAGCAQYFGGSLLAWRLIFLVIMLVPIPIFDWFGIGGLLFVGYLALAILAPKAENPEDVLRMQGRDVNPQNLAEEVSRKKNDEQSRSTLASIVSFLVKCFLGFICVWLVVMLIGILCAAAVFLTEPVTWFSTWWNWENGYNVYQGVKVPLWIAGGAGISALCILTYCTIHALLSSFGKVRSMGLGQRLAWFVAFVVCIITLFAAGFKTFTLGKPIEKAWYDAHDSHVKYEINVTQTIDSLAVEKAEDVE